jgi:hypothetical protein
MYKIHILQEDNTIGETLELDILEDDTLNTIKLKIIQAMGSRLPLDDIYLFCQHQRSVSPKQIYGVLTNQEKEELTRIRLEMFISNIVSRTPITLPEDENYFSFNDLVSLPNINWDEPLLMRKPLGQNFMVHEFTTNPLDFLGMEYTDRVTSALNTIFK